MRSIVNKKFNKLTAIRLVERIVKTTSGGNISRRYKWLFTCDCGGEIITDKDAVVAGKTRSCGCLRGLEQEQASLNAFYRGYVKGAEKRNLKFELTIEEFKEITSQDCFYCGHPPDKERKGAPYLKGFYKGSGVDRKINSIGYTLMNCVACCETCNFMKRSMDEHHFISHISKILKRRENV